MDPYGLEITIPGLFPPIKVISTGIAIYEGMSLGADYIIFKDNVEIANMMNDVYLAAFQTCLNNNQSSACGQLQDLKLRADRCIANALRSGSKLPPKN